MQNVANERFKLMKEMLSAIRSGNPYKIAKYEDIRRIESVSIQSAREPSRKERTTTVNKEVRKNDVVDVMSIPSIKQTKRNVEYGEDDLRFLFKKGIKQEKQPYEILLAHGFIDDMVRWNDGGDT